MTGSKKGQIHRTHSDEFKAEAIRRATEPGAVVAHVAEELDLSASLLTRWVRLSQGKILPSDYVKKKDAATGKSRYYSEEFKAEAVRRASEPGAIMTHIAEDMDVSANSIATWLRHAQGKPYPSDYLKKGYVVAKPAAPSAAPSGGGPDKRDEEIARLREQVAHLEEECAALRGVAGHYITKRK